MLAVSRDGALDKQTTAYDDLLDALSLSLKNIIYHCHLLGRKGRMRFNR